MIRKSDALDYHVGDRPGKIEVKPSKPCFSPRDMRMAYLPGATYPAAEIAADPAASYRLTAKGNLVAVVTNGTAVPGLGDVGPAAAKPMGEGIAVLFKRLADIDVFDLELDTRSPDEFVAAVKMLEPGFGAVNLKDIMAPEGLEIHDRLSDSLRIPVFHENLYGTAVVAMAALINALSLADKSIASIRTVICGAGTVGLGCARLLTALGAPREGLLLYDVRGLITPGRKDINRYQSAFAADRKEKTLAEGLAGADVFIGASAGGVLNQDMIRSMSRYPIVLALATPEPEIRYKDAKAARRDVIVATSLQDSPNAIVDLLSFPYILRGALDVHASRITEAMTLAAAKSLAELAREDVIDEVSRAYGYETFTFGPDYLLPKPIDPRILVSESSAVARQAIADGVAQRSVEPEAYRESLTVRLGTGREMMRGIIHKARQVVPRVVLPEGSHEAILRAATIMMDEGIARPVLLGEEELVRAAAGKFGLDLSGVPVIDPVRSPDRERYAQEYFQLRARRGVTYGVALRRLTDPRHFAALMLHKGDADMMVTGVSDHFAESLRVVLEVIGPAEGIRLISSMYMVLRPKEVYFLADCAVNIEPDAADLAEIALLTAGAVKAMGIDPRVAMLSFSNFGSVDHPFTRKVREAVRIARDRSPSLMIDGEMQPMPALDAELRARLFPFTDLRQDANVFIFPDLQSGHLALHLLQRLGDAVAVGPVLTGTRRPVHLLQHGASVQEIVNLAAVGALQTGRSERNK
ncbi:MAG: phosphate acyltransferase [Elusimicrobiota bacterium]|jgi:malate dehydrogenase (oxaloacetate-decarboxylating)(NADP+)